MKSFPVCLLGVILAATCLPGIAEAKKAKGTDAAVQATNATAFAEQSAQVRKEMKPGGRYMDITVEERAEVERNLEVIARLFAETSELGAMSDRQKVDLVNAQETANALLTKNDDDRLICATRRPTGSNFKQKQCMTARQARELREKSRDGVDRYRTPMQPALPGEGGSR